MRSNLLSPYLFQENQLAIYVQWDPRGVISSDRRDTSFLKVEPDNIWKHQGAFLAFKFFHSYQVWSIDKVKFFQELCLENDSGSLIYGQA